MKLPAPCLTGQANVLDFAAVRKAASIELRRQLTKTEAGLAAGLSAAEIRAIEAEREKQIIAAAVLRLEGYTSKSAVVEFVEGVLMQVAGGKP